MWTLPTPPLDAPAKLIPYPQKVKWDKGTTVLRNCSLKVKYFSSNELNTIIPELKEILTENGFRLVKNRNGSLPFILKKSEIEKASVQEEAYSLTVKANHIELKASTAYGIFNGLQTFRQLIHTRKKLKRIPHCQIIDWPSFKICGFMHDLGRYYQSPEFLKNSSKLFLVMKLILFTCTLRTIQLGVLK